MDLGLRKCFRTCIIKSKKLHLCCGLKYSKAVKTICICDASIAISFIVFILTQIAYWNDSNQTYTKVIKGHVTFWSFYLVKCVITLFLVVFLFHALKSKNARKCKLWISLTIFLLIISLTILLISIHLNPISSSNTSDRFLLTVLIILPLYRTYTIIVIFFTVKELERINSTCSIRKLTSIELNHFYNGNPGMNIIENGNFKAEHEPYDSKYEIEMNRLYLDTETPLEILEFGSILRGNFQLSDGSYTLVSVVSTKNTDLASFKATLSELKIMTYVSSREKHESILNLLGAFTANIRERKLVAVYEYCPFGNLQQYLKTGRRFFSNLIKNGAIVKNSARHYCNIQAVVKNELITTFDLFRWSYEISLGMKYLESIGVVHANLCAANIYLSPDKVSKISCIQLPTQLYLYSTYEKSDQNPLPWRYMAIESLRDMSFTSKSDTWGLAVVFWEIFTLGATPFSGLSWTPDFINYLSRGLRMNKPPYATDEVYKLILACWDNNPMQRPELSSICDSFESVLRKFNMLDCMTMDPFLASKDFNSKSAEIFEDNASDTDSSFIVTPLGSLTT